MEALPQGMIQQDAVRLRRVDGKWVDRLPPPEPTAAERARARADALAAGRADRLAAMTAALEAEAPLLAAETIKNDHSLHG
ncbi:MAG: hypothetical protein V4516_11300 [Pseudomonadota bacterium]